MTDILQEVIEKVNLLSEDEQLRLLAYMAERARVIVRRPRGKWMDLCGIAPNLLGGEDAQEWVNRNRRESSEHREALLRP